MKKNIAYTGLHEGSCIVLLDGVESNYKIFETGLLISWNKNKWVILFPSINIGGYHQVSLRMGKNKFNKLIHRLVGIYFIPNPNNLPCINHKDGVKINNDKSNLEWCTSSENNQHAFDIGLSSVFGRKSGGIPKKVGKYFAGILLKTYPAIAHVTKDGYPRTSIQRVSRNNGLYQGYYWKLLD